MVIQFGFFNCESAQQVSYVRFKCVAKFRLLPPKLQQIMLSTASAALKVVLLPPPVLCREGSAQLKTRRSQNKLIPKQDHRFQRHLFIKICGYILFLLFNQRYIIFQIFFVPYGNKWCNGVGNNPNTTLKNSKFLLSFDWSKLLKTIKIKSHLFVKSITMVF